MNYVCNGEIIDINTEKPFGKGSEGQLYLKNEKLYKIFYENVLNEGYKDRYKNHEYLSKLNTKQISLPKDLLFDTDGNYVGYTTNLISKKHNKYKNITLLPSKDFLQNLKTILEDIRYLSDNYVMLSDITSLNTIFENGLIYLIDPGRYVVSDRKFERVNMRQFKDLIASLIYFDLMIFQKFGKANAKRIERLLYEDIPEMCIYDYFQIELEDYPNVLEYTKKRLNTYKK